MTKRTLKSSPAVAKYLAKPLRQRQSLINAAHVLTAMRSDGLSLRQAARQHGISPQTVQRHAGSALRKTSEGTYKARNSDKMLRVMLTPTAEGMSEIVIRDSRTATTVAEHANAVQTFLQTGDDSDLRRFIGQYVIDAQGHRVPLLTDLDELERLGTLGVLSFESLYAKVG